MLVCQRVTKQEEKLGVNLNQPNVWRKSGDLTNPPNMEEQLGFNRGCNQPKWWIMVDLTTIMKNIWRTRWDLTNQKWSKLGLNKQQK
jgi:hypothetical protein